MKSKKLFIFLLFKVVNVIGLDSLIGNHTMNSFQDHVCNDCVDDSQIRHPGTSPCPDAIIQEKSPKTNSYTKASSLYTLATVFQSILGSKLKYKVSDAIEAK